MHRTTLTVEIIDQKNQPLTNNFQESHWTAPVNKIAELPNASLPVATHLSTNGVAS